MDDPDYTDEQIRDWLAGQALMGICAAMAHPQSINPWPENLPEAAAKAFDIADAMIAERKKRQEKTEPEDQPMQPS